MIRVKKTCEIDVRRLEANTGEGTHMVNFQVLNNGNIAMIFETPGKKGNELRYTIKIHTRLGIQRQCSFTAIESRLENVILYMNELYAIMSEGEKLTINRLEPETKENLFPLKEGKIHQVIGLSRNSLMIAYEDGSVAEYTEGNENIVQKAGDRASLSLDFNRRYMVAAGSTITRFDERGIKTYETECSSIEGFLLARGDRAFAVCSNGRFTEYSKEGDMFAKKDDIVDMDVRACSMVKDTAALYDGDMICMYKLM